MNLAIGFPCPECGHETANIVEFVKDEIQILSGFRLHCLLCETVYVETRMSTAQDEDLRSELILDDALRWS
jgi:uncharacterized Zn finger protein